MTTESLYQQIIASKLEAARENQTRARSRDPNRCPITADDVIAFFQPVFCLFDLYHEMGVRVPGSMGRGEIFRSGAVARNSCIAEPGTPKVRYYLTPLYQVVITLAVKGTPQGVSDLVDSCWRCRLLDHAAAPASEISNQIGNHRAFLAEWFADTVTQFELDPPGSYPGAADIGELSSPEITEEDPLYHRERVITFRDNNLNEETNHASTKSQNG